MRFSYVAWDEARHGAHASPFDRLFDLFQQLLSFTAGDAAEALDWMEQLDQRYDGLTSDDYTLADFTEELRKRGYLQGGDDEEGGGPPRITGKTERALRQRALDAVFDKLQKDGHGRHRTPHSGEGDERLPETRAWTFGDDVSRLDVSATLSNAFRRDGEFTLSEDDVEVYETEHHAHAATVLMIDLSHSMVLYGEDRITPARTTALALAELITTRYPKDTLDIVAFGTDAWEVSLKELPYLQVGPYYTNTRAGLQRARDILRRRKTRNRQILMITDGKPSCHYEAGPDGRAGKLYRNAFGLDPVIVNKVLDEGVACRREGIPITTFMIARDPQLQQFVHDLTAANQGRAYYSSLDDLGSFVFEDFVRNRRRNVR